MAIAYRMTVKLDKAAVDKAAGDLAYREVVRVTRRVFNRANVLTPVRFGNLRLHNKIRADRASLTGEVWNDAEYAGAVHEGLKDPVVIRPKRSASRSGKKGRAALRFKVGGRWVFARKVTIPPRRGRPFLYRALQEVANQTGYTISKP